MSASSSRRGLLIAFGAIITVSGLIGAVLLWSGAAQRRDSAIENFARAPIGCDTTLDFIEPGEYLLFVETAGVLDGVRGDCDVEGAFDNTGRVVPDVEITLVDPDGAQIDLDRSFGNIEYDAAGFRGVAYRSVEIQETDDHVLRAEADVDDVFVVAVGRDPNDGVAALRTGAVAAGGLGLLVGLALVLFGARKSTTQVPAGAWPSGVAPQPGSFVPGGAAPQGPPVYGYQSGPPQYGQQQPPPPQPQYGQPQYGQGGPPVYGQPQPAQAPPYGQQPDQQAPQPAPQQYPHYSQPPAGQPRIPGQPDLPGQPSFPPAPIDPGSGSQPTDWAPQGPGAPTSGSNPSETAPPDADDFAHLREERPAQDRPPPPPPE